jgi:arylsulfatase A
MKWLGRLCIAIVALLLLTPIVIWLDALATINNYEQTDNSLRVENKQHYLAEIETLTATEQRPNIVFILFDDLGYGDLGYTGSQSIATPTIDSLAAGGIVLNQFYSPSPVCTPARAGYLTGRLPARAGTAEVAFPKGGFISDLQKYYGVNLRMPAEEITMADILQASGYITGMVGKWHLGDISPSLPNDMGFDDFYGALYSNDMQPFAMYRNRDIAVAAPVDQTQLNDLYGGEAEQFIARQTDKPFFLYFAHNFPHVPLYIPDEDKNRSQGGLYGDLIEGLDDTVKRIVTALKIKGVYENTIIILTSDNGPWYQGSPGSNRGRKNDIFEGGMHVPMLFHWPQQLAPGKSLDGMSMGIDLLPTVLDWLQLPAPKDRIIDGKSIRTMLEQDQPSPHQYLYYYRGQRLFAVRDSRYKYHEVAHYYYANDLMPVTPEIHKGPWLFDLSLDNNESYDISANRPEVLQRMESALKAKRDEMAANKRGWLPDS